MERLTLLLLLVGAALAAPANESKDSKESKEDRLVPFTKQFFSDDHILYSSEYNIEQILANTEDLIFFVEADDNSGDRKYKGVSLILGDSVMKVLETGTDVAAAQDYTKSVYFAATDGLYSYNYKKKTAEKYGTITDNLIGIAKARESDAIYILTNENIVYNVTEEGTKKVKVDHAVGAKQIVLDYNDNLYYYGADNRPYVVDERGAKMIDGLPENLREVTLIKPMLINGEGNGVPFGADGQGYRIYANGTSRLAGFKLKVKPTAFSFEAGMMQYYGYNKNIYQYYILTLNTNEMIDFLLAQNEASENGSVVTKIINHWNSLLCEYF